ncbi:hypothetical protein B1L11_43180 [Microbispora sp. GKU 823]|nr:hypothetical protein B1L11_43180 [Microbispora sp. GKU 823]
MTSTGIRIIALVLASKRDYSAYNDDGDGIRWPMFTYPEIAKKLHTSERTVERAVERLKRDGFLRTRQTKRGDKQGNEYEVLSPELADDTFRGKPRISRRAQTWVAMSVITAHISDRAFHLLLMLEATAKSWASAKIPQSKLIKYFPSNRSAGGHTSLTQLNVWLRELEAAGLLIRNRERAGDKNEYILHKEEVVVNGARIADVNALPVLALPTQHTEEEMEDDILNAPRGMLGFSGMDLARAFRKKIKDRAYMDREWAAALKRPGSIKLPAMAHTFDRWLSDGMAYSDINAMIDYYPANTSYGADPKCLPEHVKEYLGRTPIWKDFLNNRALLAAKVAERRKEASYWDSIDGGKSFDTGSSVASADLSGIGTDGDGEDRAENREDLGPVSFFQETGPDAEALEDEDREDETEFEATVVDYLALCAKDDTPQGITRYFNRLMDRNGHRIGASCGAMSSTFYSWLREFTADEIRDKIVVFVEKADFGPRGDAWSYFVETYGPVYGPVPVPVPQDGSIAAQVLAMLSSRREDQDRIEDRPELSEGLVELTHDRNSA